MSQATCVIKGASVQTLCLDESVLESLNASEIADQWAKLTEAAKTDPEARAFLAMFEPWAKAKLDRPRS